MSSECSFFCTGDSYNLSELSSALRRESMETKIHNREVLHVKYVLPGVDNPANIFVYAYGCIVFWGVSDNAASSIMKKFETYLNKPLKRATNDKCMYEIVEADESSIDVENDVILLQNASDIHLLQLSFSYGLSQSVKLSVFEDSADKTIEENQVIPDQLINTGKIPFSKRELAQKIGYLLAEKNYINLQNNVLDTPDFFWRHPKYEPYYKMSIKFHDLPQRIDILNSKLGIIADLYSILSSELQHAYSSRLEIIVIILIFFEVCIGIIELLHR